MTTFTIQAPDGKGYTIEGDNAEGALAALKKHLSSEAAPDKYQQAATEEDKAIGGGDAGYTRRLAHGATLGADSTILAGLQTPLEMIKRGTIDPREGYNYAKAREDLIMNKAREKTGLLGTAAEVLGGGVSGAGLASGGLTAARFLAPEAGLFARSAASAADAGALGGFSGAMEGNGVAERFNNAVKGLAAGGALGGLTPGALKLAGAALSPVISNIRARVNPEGFAQSQIARGIHESGIDPNELSLRTVQAANEGQPQYTLADAMGNAGQRLLSTVARAPGEGRTAVVSALEGRQADQGRRVAGALAEGFDSPQTATQTEARLTGARDTAANAEYGAVRHDAQPVDVSGAISRIDETLAPYGVPHDISAHDTAAAALAKYRARLTDGRGTNNDFNAVQRVRGDLSDEIQQARQSGAGNKARLLGGLLRELDSSLETSSNGFRQANRNFARASQDIEAVQSGRDAAMRGRPEDTIPAFQALRPEGQQAYRAGYVDPLIAQTQAAASGANKARPLINDAFQTEAGVMAPGNQMMQRRLGREQTMFETRNAALGGSKTADNLNDHAAMGVDPHLVGQVLTGNWHGALRNALSAGHSALSGNTPAVRREVANILLQNGGNISPARLNRMVLDTVARIQFVQNIARNVGRGAAGGLAVAVPGTQRRQ
jgi:hypothetical protein